MISPRMSLKRLDEMKNKVYGSEREHAMCRLDAVSLHHAVAAFEQIKPLITWIAHFVDQGSQIGNLDMRLAAQAVHAIRDLEAL